MTASARLLKRILPDGRILELVPMLFNLRITVTLPEHDGLFWEDAWCYKDKKAALSAYLSWDGTGEDGPPGWNKHPHTGRWRADGTAASEEVRR
jgi:hypothetical protein